MENNTKKKQLSYPEAMRIVTKKMVGEKVLSNKLISGTFSEDWAIYKAKEKANLPIFKAEALREIGVFKF